MKKYLLIAFSLVGLVLILVYFSLAFYVGSNSESDSKIKSDVILVPGAKSYRGNNYNPCLLSRVEHAVGLYKQGYASKILVSGGTDIEDGVNEADTMKKMAVELGVPPEDIQTENNATSTYENFSFSQKIINDAGLKSVIIVTEPFHIARAGLVARKLGFNFTVSPAVNSPCWKPNKYFTKYFTKEPTALIMYKLQNKL